MYHCKYFTIKELVSPKIFNKFGDFSWKFFDEDVLKDLDIIREYHGQPIIINNGTTLTQCGLRCNLDPLVKNKTGIYCSAHLMGKAFDLHSSDNKKLYEHVIFLIQNKILKVIKRLESCQSTKDQWVHVDSFRTDEILEIFVA